MARRWIDPTATSVHPQVRCEVTLISSARIMTFPCSNAQLKQIFAAYRRYSSVDIEETIRMHIDGTHHRVLTAIGIALTPGLPCWTALFCLQFKSFAIERASSPTEYRSVCGYTFARTDVLVVTFEPVGCRDQRGRSQSHHRDAPRSRHARNQGQVSRRR